ncbi:PQQ-binding-like beta-propeller repeat protein [Sphingomonas sp. BIUV-7]|uniref:PQQ-binding-like beta-propeller repeat protein n=1 Tax=Sphingomonas natans TaxID=3063330 RepID=A0ABT8YE49_9SPHN|nr:PQQ-like beta-propeller repeat protein [Sphingomonas sp. BIUV-7]MDO6416599.1 PQQ-binding-like beta-propeller repeat protein [Sphingomonas sp. BIUV-7]
MRNVSRALVAVALVAGLGGCGIFKGGNKPKTAVLGERIPVLATQNDAEVDPSLSDTPVTLPAPAANEAWAQPGGNPAHSMGHLALGLAPARVWTARIPKSTPQQRYGAAPVVAGGRLYVMDADSVVHAFSLENGAQVWKQGFAEGKKDKGALFGGGVTFDDGKLFAVNGLGDAVAMDAATGKQLWKVRPGGPLRGAPTVGLGNVYVVTQDNQVFALKVEDGKTAWTDSATLEAAGVFGVAAPALGRGTIVAGFSSGELSALRYENGRVVWQDQLARTSITTSVATISDIDASPVIDNDRVYAIGQGGRMVAMDLAAGQRLWELNVGGGDTPWVVGDWLFVLTDESKLLCVNRATGKVRWLTQLERFRNKKKKDNPIQWSGPILAGGRLFVVSDRGEIVGVQAVDGVIRDTIKGSGPFQLAPIAVNNMLITLDGKGTITAYR